MFLKSTAIHETSIEGYFWRGGPDDAVLPTPGLMIAWLSIEGLLFHYRMQPIAIVVDRLIEMARGFLAHLPQLALGIFVLGAIWLLAKLLDRLLRRVFGRIGLRQSLAELFRQLVAVVVWLIGILAAAVIVFPTLTPAKVLTAIGLGSIAIGFAFKDIFENFLAGMLLLLREPFKLRDFIECQDLEGFVEEITIRDTHIRRSDGQRVVIPNAMLFKSPVTVRTDLDRRRVTLICGVAYGEDVAEARKTINDAVVGLETVDKDKEVQIFAQAFGSSSIDFEVTWWTGSRPLEVRKSRDEVVTAVKRALDEAGIEIPFPYRTLTFKEPLQTFAKGAEPVKEEEA